MRKNAHSETAAAAPHEQRKLVRKDVLLSGVLCDAKGAVASECIIRDIHAQGAALSLQRKLTVGEHVFLLNTGNGTAHEARVAWSKDDRSGLSFVRSYTMGLGLPPTLKFLWRLQFEAKLRQVERAIASGVAAKLALSTAGMTREHIHQMARHASSDKKLLQLLQRAATLVERAAATPALR